MLSEIDRKEKVVFVKQQRNSSSLESAGLYPREHRPESSLRNLSLGILLQAFRDVVAPKKSSNKEWRLWRQDALDWFASEESYPGSFQWVCEVLEMNQRELRQWLEIYLLSGKDRQRELARKLTRFQIRH